MSDQDPLDSILGDLVPELLRALIPPTPSLVSICVDCIVKNRLIDDHRLLEATARATTKKTEQSLITNVSTTFAELPMELQVRIMERAVELGLMDDFWIGYFIPSFNELGALNARGCGITNAGIELIVGGCPYLLSLDLSFCKKITGNGFCRLVDLPELENLSLEGTNITSNALLQLSRMNTLRNVNIRSCTSLKQEAVKKFLLSLDNIKDFLYDDWQLEADGSEWQCEPTDPEDFEEFDPDETYDRLVGMMDRFAH